jgi:transposase
LSNRKIANNLQISRDTVNIYVQRISGGGRSLEELLSLTDEHIASYLMAPAVPEKRDKRYEQLMPLLPAMVKELAQPHMTRRVLWEAYRKDNPDGYAYSQFCSIMERCIGRTNAVMHLEHKPGEELYFDFASDKLCYFDPGSGGVIPWPLFIAVIPISRFTHVWHCISPLNDWT